jgi:Tfp pilus assembly protein PilF
MTSFARILAVALAVLPWNLCAQHLTYAEWQVEARRDGRLNPAFKGHRLTPEQMASNNELVKQVLASGADRRTASDHLVDLGRQHLAEGDLRKAIYRFNHAWLVDSTNARAYHGFGLFFIALDRSTEAGAQFALGLDRDSSSVELLRDMAATLLDEQGKIRDGKPERADTMVKAALHLLLRAEQHVPNDTTVLLRIASCHVLLKQCKDAQTWTERYERAGGSGEPRAVLRESLRRSCPAYPVR